MEKIYVTPHINDWAVKQEGEKALISVFDTKEEAIEAAKKIAESRETDLVILKRDGVIEKLIEYS